MAGLASAIAFMAILGTPHAGAAADPPHWSGSFAATGLNGAVRCLLEADSVLYAGGDFTTVDAGNQPAPHVAYWQQGRWTKLGYGLNGPVTALVRYQGRIVAAGDFTGTDETYSGSTVPVQRIAVWGNGVWRQDISPTPGEIHDLLPVGDSLFVACAGSPGASTTLVRVWNNGEWRTVAGTVIPAKRLAWYRGSLHAAGPAGVFRFDGVRRTWVSLQEPETAVTSAMVVWGDRLVLAGSGFFHSGAGVIEVAAWDGTGWTSLGEGRGTVTGLEVHDGSLYIAGAIEALDGNGPARVLRLAPDLSGWTRPGEPSIGRALALRSTSQGLLLGGDQQTGDGGTYALVAAWDGAAWDYHNGGLMLDTAPLALAPFQDGMVAAGAFDTAGRDSMAHVARLSHGRWWPLGGGVNDYAWALQPFEGRLIVAGAFDRAGGVPAAHIAAWDGTAWAPLGEGLDGNVYTLCVYRGRLYAGGAFRHSGAKSVEHIAWWDGTTWQSPGGGVDGWVTALGVARAKLWVGGFFDAAGAVASPKLATWNDTTWAGTGAQLPVYASVRAIAEYAGEVYVGGHFYTIGGVSSRNIARTDGTTWRAVGKGLSGDVIALLKTRGLLLVGSEGDPEIGRAALWSGEQWDTDPFLFLSAGNNGGFAGCFAEDQGSLYIGGQFGGAGTRTRSGDSAALTSVNIARWDGLSSLVPVTATNLKATRIDDGSVRVEWDVPRGARQIHGVNLLRGSTVNDRAPVASNWSQADGHFTMADADPPHEQTSYWAELVDAGGARLLVLGPIPLEASTAPLQAFVSMPNPFSSAVQIDVEARSGGVTALQIFDIQGRLIRRLATQQAEPGRRRVTWDGHDDRGLEMPAGIYLVRILDGKSHEAHRLVKVH